MNINCFLPLQEAEEKKEEKTEFTVKLTRYADDSKIKVIKEVKNLVEGLNLVQVSQRCGTYLSGCAQPLVSRASRSS